MFASTRPFTLFDYFRVPYERTETVDVELRRGLAALTATDKKTFLAWPTADLLVREGVRPGGYFVGAAPLFGRVATETQLRRWLADSGGDWHRMHELRDGRGTAAAAIWQRDDGSTFLPFDPNELIESFWTERYLQYARPAALRRLAEVGRRGYYRARPFLPRHLQMRMRRSFSRVQSKAQLPRWPIETALHDLYSLLFTLVGDLTNEPIPYIAPWPRTWSWALVLTHDVETQVGYDRLTELLQIELDLGYRSSWNFVPQERYVVGDDLVASLRDRGFEIGVHGLNHDGRDVSSLANLQRRLPTMRSYAERWGATGFRSPGTLRSAALMPLLNFDYDSSYSDTAPFEPQAGGCCTWLPYMLGNLVELPITLVQDHTLFDLLGHEDERLWLEKTHFLRDRHGMALVLTHSDYVANPYLVDSYRRLLDEFAGDVSAWKALPRDVSDWWRRRARSSLQRHDDGWAVIGPAEGDARIEFVADEALTV
jgi:peptidoglycan/xylan/chitin deacetylase (PgdA/CDA1 family)